MHNAAFFSGEKLEGRWYTDWAGGFCLARLRQQSARFTARVGQRG